MEGNGVIWACRAGAAVLATSTFRVAKPCLNMIISVQSLSLFLSFITSCKWNHCLGIAEIIVWEGGIIDWVGETTVSTVYASRGVQTLIVRGFLTFSTIIAYTMIILSVCLRSWSTPHASGYQWMHCAMCIDWNMFRHSIKSQLIRQLLLIIIYYCVTYVFHVRT